MIENRELTMDDYLAMMHRRAKAIVLPMLAAVALAYVAYIVCERYFAKYTSTSLVLVEGQKVPENMVQPVVTDDLEVRISRLRAQATSDSQMRPKLATLFPNKSSDQIDAMLEDMRGQPDLVGQPFTDVSQLTGSSYKKKPGQEDTPGFKVSYTAPNPKQAQLVTETLTSLILQDNLNFIQESVTGTVNVLDDGLDKAKHTLDDMNAKLADFKHQHEGQLPTDQDANLKMLATLSQQQDAYTQRENLAQQDKSYNQTQLAQQLAAWKSSQSSTDPQVLQKQLSDLQAQLIDLKSRYTDDYPDVVKTKADIAEIKQKLDEINKASDDASGAGNDKGSATEPAQIKGLRQQIQKDNEEIAESNREIKRLTQSIAQYQQHLSVSPSVEQEYDAMLRDYDNAAKTYDSLLKDKSAADLTAHMTSQAQGERMSEVQPADLPDSPTFPNLWIFLGVGVGVGFSIGVGIAMWMELRDKSIRTEADAEAALELPMLVAVPWVGVAAADSRNGNNGKPKFWKRKKGDLEPKEPVGV